MHATWYARCVSPPPPFAQLQGYNNTMYDLAASVLQTRIALNQHTGGRTKRASSMFETGEARNQDFDTKSEEDQQERYEASMQLLAGAAHTPDIAEPPDVYTVGASGEVVEGATPSVVSEETDGYREIDGIEGPSPRVFTRSYSRAKEIKAMSVDVRRALHAPKEATVSEQVRGELAGQQTQVALDSQHIQAEMQMQRDVFENKKVSEQVRGELAGQQTQVTLDSQHIQAEMQMQRDVFENKKVSEQVRGELAGQKTEYGVDGKLMSEDIAQNSYVADLRRVNPLGLGELAGKKTEYGVDGKLMSEDIAQNAYVAKTRRVNEQFIGGETVGQKTLLTSESREVSWASLQNVEVSQIRRVNDQFRGESVGEKTLLDGNDTTISRVRNAPKPVRQNSCYTVNVGDGRDKKADVSFHDETDDGMPTASWRNSLPADWAAKMNTFSAVAPAVSVVAEESVIGEEPVIADLEDDDATTIVPNTADGGVDRSAIIDDQYASEGFEGEVGGEGEGTEWMESTALSERRSSYETAVATPTQSAPEPAADAVTTGENGKRVAIV